MRAKKTVLAGIAIALMAVSGLVPAANAAPGESAASAEVDQVGYEVYFNGERYEAPAYAALSFDPVSRCAANDPVDKHIRVFQRSWSSSGVGVLVCGDTGYGWRHMIAGGKDAAWNGIVTKYGLGGSWEDFALWATAQVLQAPGGIPDTVNGKTVYIGHIEIRNYNPDIPARTYLVTVPVIASNDRIVTSYPSGGFS